MYARDFGIIATPIGVVRIDGDDETIDSVSIGQPSGSPTPATSVAVRMAIEQLEEWLVGARQTFDLPLSPSVTPRGGVLRQAMIAISYATR